MVGMTFVKAPLGASRRRNQKGVVLAEFALILPILLMMIFGIVQFGIAYNRSLAVHGAAREGARVASLPTSSQADACNRATSSLGDVAFASAPTCTWSGGCAGTQAFVTVTIQAQTDVNIPFWPGSGLINLDGVGEFRCE